MSPGTRPYVILDRDGVINEDSPDYIKTSEEWIPVPGSLEAIARLTNSGFDVYVATNQAGVARGKLTLADLDEIHELMISNVQQAGGRIHDIRFCIHHPDDQCACRKPEPGMLLDLAECHNLDLKAGYYVGDSQKDLQAAKAAGCQGVLVLSGKGLETQQALPDYKPVYPDLLSFVIDLLN